MNPLNVAQMYFDAWNRRDPAAIAACFAEGGTYNDPACGGTLAGEAIGHYASSLFAAFPDLSFEIVSANAAGEDTVAAQWLMRGTNSGSLSGNPPTGNKVALPGAVFIAVEGSKIRSVKGYFDQKNFVEQLGLQTIVQPHSIGPILFGSSVYLNTGNFRKPGAFSLTWIQLKTPEEAAEVDGRGAEILEELAKTPGFISAVLTTVGLKGHTITAWEDAEAPKQLLTAGPHREAMDRFFGSGLGVAGLTSVWVPARIGGQWIRCEACLQMQNRDRAGDQQQCRCGAPLPEPLPYW